MDQITDRDRFRADLAVLVSAWYRSKARWN